MTSDAAQQPNPGNPLDPSVLAWVEDAIGARLFAYLLGCDTEVLPTLISGGVPLGEKQLAVAALFSNLRAQVPTELDDVTSKTMVRNFVTQITPDGKSIAMSIHQEIVGPETVPAGRDAVESALIGLAVDAYPACLLSRDPILPPEVHDLGPSLMTVIFRHPQSKAFSDAVYEDSALKDTFEREDGPIGGYATVSRNTGIMGNLQLLMLPDSLLQSAWRKLPVGSSTLDNFIAAAIKELQLLRDVISGKQRAVTALLAFTGVLLPPGRELRLSDGLVRAVTDVDRRLVPESLKGQLNTTDQTGTTVTINYDGDVVLEYDFPYVMRAEPGQVEAPPVWPVEMRPPLAMEQTVMRLRFSLMLAVERDYRVQLIQTWRAFDEPLSPGMVRSWSDPRQGAGFAPGQLTDAEVDAWGEWYDRLNTADVVKIELALSRILRAVAERREPSDVLIDSVIAWENLFGTKEGEPTFRVTMCLAKLLEQDIEARLKLRTRLGKIYALRSKVVHGGGILRDADHSFCNEALDVAIRAVRALTTDRVDILRLPDGAHRSAALLLGE